MHFSDQPPPPPADPDLAVPGLPWWRELNGYHWFVLVAAALGWMFDTMDQQLFVLARTPALKTLLGEEADVALYGGYATAIFMVGWATGGLIFGLFGDRWGRARTMMLTILVYSLFTGLSALSRSWWDFALYRFLTGMGVGGEFAAGVALVAEVMPNRARPYALGLLQALSAVGNVSAAFISFLVPPQLEIHGVEGWRLMFLVGILPALLVVLLLRKLREPASWLRAREALLGGERTDELHRQLGDLGELFRDPRWRSHTLIGVTLAMVGVMGLWGVGFWNPELIRNNVLKDLPPRDQDWYASLAMVLQNLGGFFGVYAFTWLTGHFGRRKAFAASFLLGLGAVVLVFGFMTERSQIWWMVPVLGFGTLTVFGGYAIYFPELYPTRLRSTGTGFCYNVARYLAAAAPFLLGKLTDVFRAPPGTERGAQGLSDFTLLSSLGSSDNALRYAALAVASVYLLGLLVLPFAPETRGQPLPE
jgi:MFS family permease